MTHKRSKRPTKTRGAAVVELAICLPVLFFIVFGSIEASHTVFLKQALREASYHGASVAIRPGSSETDVTTATLTVLTARGIQATSATAEGISGASFDTLKRGDLFRVTADADIGPNRLLPTLFVKFTNIESSTVGRKQ